MWELMRIGGWVMVPIVGCYILAIAIMLERAWILREPRVAPADLVPEVWRLVATDALGPVNLRRLRAGSPLGRVIAAGLTHAGLSRADRLERIEETGRVEALQLERHLTTLGTIAAVTPLLGLLGTVIGMIDVFAGIDAEGLSDHRALAGGIGEALITTGAGLTVAIPTVAAHRYLRGRANRLIVAIEREALKLADVLDRNPMPAGKA
ncbi:biopolymer transporter ExbB [Spiribacter sp. SSL99]|uniref:MotA/TolQ/ExbB proton channel family protein n=1 Tax=Spiribacter sp. SSL99 TaxID=1866884 RepID=UPI001330F995|nr:MotA/TolQ/ExbB proton channel family protein [Spiribacter sp. SSL99]KAF0284902.1 biopolymer transporter ExbB [Spiribacter sp. SSL99]